MVKYERCSLSEVSFSEGDMSPNRHQLPFPCGRSTSASGCATLFLIEINGGAGRQDEDVVHMVNERMYGLGAEPSAIRELFAYGMVRKAEIGAENVFDFSIGNPSVPAPDAVKQAVLELMDEEPSAGSGRSARAPGRG